MGTLLVAGESGLRGVPIVEMMRSGQSKVQMFGVITLLTEKLTRFEGKFGILIL
jgi:hypothetical protein